MAQLQVLGLCQEPGAEGSWSQDGKGGQVSGARGEAWLQLGIPSSFSQFLAGHHLEKIAGLRFELCKGLGRVTERGYELRCHLQWRTMRLMAFVCMVSSASMPCLVSRCLISAGRLAGCRVNELQGARCGQGGAEKERSHSVGPPQQRRTRARRARGGRGAWQVTRNTTVPPLAESGQGSRQGDRVRPRAHSNVRPVPAQGVSPV